MSQHDCVPILLTGPHICVRTLQSFYHFVLVMSLCDLLRASRFSEGFLASSRSQILRGDGSFHYQTHHLHLQRVFFIVRITHTKKWREVLHKVVLHLLSSFFTLCNIKGSYCRNFKFGFSSYIKTCVDRMRQNRHIIMLNALRRLTRQTTSVLIVWSTCSVP